MEKFFNCFWYYYAVEISLKELFNFSFIIKVHMINKMILICLDINIFFWLLMNVQILKLSLSFLILFWM